jgi:hypothetical protein
MIDIVFTIFAGLIAYAGYYTKYRYISAVLFVEFLLMLGYQLLSIALQSHVFIFNQPEYAVFYVAWFHIVKAILQACLLVIYVALASTALSALSAVIIGYMLYCAAVTMSGGDVAYYEYIMITISALQLVAGAAGVFNGYRSMPNHIRHYPYVGNH